MPPFDTPSPVELPIQITQKIAEKLSQAVARDGTAVTPSWKPQPQMNETELQNLLTNGLNSNPFTPLKGMAGQVQGPHQQSGGGSDTSNSRAPSKEEAAMNFANSLDFAKKHFAQIDTDKDGQLSLGEVQGALNKAENTADAGKLGAVFSNFDQVRKSGEFNVMGFHIGEYSNGIEKNDIDAARENVTSKNNNVREADAADKAMLRHDMYSASHADKMPIDNVHEASAWLQGNLKKYDKTKDGELSQLEILGALLSETDPKAKQMLNVLNDNYDQLKHKNTFFEKQFSEVDGITLKDAQKTMTEIEQKRDARDISKSLLDNNSQLFNALDSARNGKSDGIVKRGDLEAFVAEHTNRLRQGKPPDGVHTTENILMVRDMLKQWGNTKSPLARLTGVIESPSGGPMMLDSFRLKAVKDALKI